MFFKNRKFNILNFALILALFSGLFGVVPTLASTEIDLSEFSSSSSSIVPQLNISTPPNPVGIRSRESKLVKYSLTESGNISGRISSRTYQFFTQYDVPLSEVMGPYPTNINIDPLQTNDWNELVYLPESVAEKARSVQDYAVVLKTTFKGISASGAEFSAQASLLLLLPPANFSKASPANGAAVAPAGQSLQWNSSVGAIDYEYCFDTIDNNSCDTNWTGTYWLGTYDTNVALQNLPSNTTFYWQVRANNTAGTTYANNSNWWSFITSDLSTPTPTHTPTFTPTNTPTFTATPPYSYNPLYISLTGNQTIGGVASADEDILRFDGTNWSLFFDGSDVGVGGSDLFGFSFLDADSILMSFNSAVTLNGMSVTPRDVLRFDATSLGSNTAGTFSMYLNGIDVGLDVAAENIDSVSLLPDGHVLISTTGNPVVAGVTGAKDEDVLAFTSTALGNNTSGTWAMYFDGSDVGLAETSGEDVDALDITSNGRIYLSTSGDFSVTGISGADEDVFVCVPTSVGNVTACNYSSTLYFDGSTWNLSANDVDAFNFLSTGPVPTNTPSITPTATPTRTKTPTMSVTPTLTPSITATSTRTPTSTVGPSPTNTSTPTNTPNISDLIFANGFESGNLSGWTSNTNDLGDLSASAASALVGNQGMQAVLDDNNTIYVTDDSPNAEPRYRARFYFDPNSIPMLSGDAHFIFKGFMGTSTEVLRMEFRQSAGLYQLRIALLDDGSTWINSTWFTISDASHFIELDWHASTAVAANNGALTFWIDGVQQANLIGVDNDTRRIDRARLGALTGVDNGTRGTYFFDAFESRRQNYIGPAISVSTPTPTAPHTPTITPTAGNGSAHAEVYVGGVFQNAYDVSPQSSVRPSYVGLNNGPVRVRSTNGVAIVASERFAYNDGSTWTSYSEIMGMPHDEVTTSYSFPWYDNVDFDSQLRFANVGNASTTVTVTVGGIMKGSYVLAPNQGQHVSYPGLDNGPVKLQSSGGVPIVASLRIGHFNGSAWTSHSEIMGLPQGQLSTSYVFPWYNNVDLNSQLRFGNVGNTSATVTVTVGGVVRGSYILAPNQSQQVSYAGVDSGPVKVESSDGVPIIASERVAYFNGSAWTSHSELMGLPAALLSTNYSFPVYDNVNHNSQLRFGNVGNTTATLTVTINGIVLGNYLLAPNQSQRVSYAGVNSGPVVIQSSGGVPIIASNRVAYFNGSAWTSFSELIGLPYSQLSTSYFFPWYDNVNIDTQLMVGVP